MAQTQTVISGVDGSIAFAALNGGSIPQGKFNYWTLVVGQVVNNITGFDSSGFQEYFGGVKFGRHGASGHAKYNAATTNPLGSTTAADILPKSGATGTYTIATGCTIGWVSVVESYTFGSDVNGDFVFSIGGPCSGTPTLAWDET